jgi:hypothetical protein
MKAKQLLFALLCFGVLSTVTGCYVDPGPSAYSRYPDRREYWREQRREERREERARERAQEWSGNQAERYWGYLQRQHE